MALLKVTPASPNYINLSLGRGRLVLLAINGWGSPLPLCVSLFFFIPLAQGAVLFIFLGVTGIPKAFPLGLEFLQGKLT